MIEKLDPLYAPLEKVFKVDRRTLNIAYTPEIVGTLQEIFLDTICTPFGSALLNTIFGLIYLYIAGKETTEPAKTLWLELATHAGTRWIKLFAPATANMALSNIQTFGAGVKSASLETLQTAIFKSPGDIKSEIDALIAKVKSLLGRGGGGVTAMQYQAPVTPEEELKPVKKVILYE